LTPNPMSPIRLLSPYYRQNRLRIWAGVACLITVDMLQLAIPRVIKQAVDGLTAGTITPAGLSGQGLAIVGLGLLIGFFRYFWRRFLIGWSRRVEEGLRDQLFNHLQSLSAAYFDQARTGDLMAHATNDIQSIRMATGMGIVALTDAVVMGLAAIGFMLYINVRLTAFVLIPMPLIVLGTRFFSKRLHSRYTLVQAAFSRLTETVREYFAGIRTVKAYGMEAAATEAVAKASLAYVDDNIRLTRVTRALFPMMVMLSSLSLAMVIFLGGRLTILGVITAGDFVAFISYLGLITWPMMAMGWVTNLVQRGKASLQRIDTVLKTRPAVAQVHPERRQLPRDEGICFENVCFAYASATQTPVLKNVSFFLESGKNVGIVGPPGAGKSTLLQLICRLYDAATGTIRLGGADLPRIDLSDLRRRIALVPQEPFLFSGSVRDNITFADPAVTPQRLEEAVHLAAVDTAIAALPAGFDTVVGEKGVILSGGQKQRIGLARALLKDAPILILDDPVSQVDTATAGRIIDTLKQLARTKTLIIVSHRLAAVRFADTILTIENGAVTEAGNHERLIAAGGYYARTHHLQQITEAFDAP